MINRYACYRKTGHKDAGPMIVTYAGRTQATNLLDRGMNIQDVAAILGHADLKTTPICCYISQANVKAAYRKYAA